MTRHLAAPLVALGLAAGTAQADTIDMQSIYPGTLPLLGQGGVELGERVSRVTGGELTINFYNPGELVAGNEIWDSVSTGAVDAGWYSPGFAEGVIPSAALFTAFPFGPDVREYTAWWYYGGGAELWAEITEPYNIHTELCTILAPEASGWFRQEINTVDDLQGMKMRVFGLGAAVFQKLGVEAQNMSPSDTMSALNLGTIDAAELSFPAIDDALGMHEHANHYYFPGWHQQTSLIVFIINKDVWDGLSETNQAAIAEVCAATVARSTAQGEAIQLEPLAKMQEENGAIVHRWNDEMMAAFRGAWDEVVAEKSAESEEFARVWDHIQAFREKYDQWSELGYVR